MRLYEDSFIHIDTEELDNKDKEVINKLTSKEPFTEEDYYLLDEITDMYMARRIIVKLLDDRKCYKDIAEDSLTALKELSGAVLRVTNSVLGGNSGE